MYRDLLTDATFHQLLLACDRDLADTARGAGCKRCSGVVHSAHYWRNTIRAWLGHVSLDTTNIYAETDLATKKRALATLDRGRTRSATGGWSCKPDVDNAEIGEATSQDPTHQRDEVV